MLGCSSIFTFRRLAIASTTSFSRLPPRPTAPGSSPPWPGSRAMVIMRVNRGALSSLGVALALRVSGCLSACSGLASTTGGVMSADLSASHSPLAISAAIGSGALTGYRSNTSRCLYAPTGASVNTCGLIFSLRSNTRRTTFGRFWPTRTCLM